MFRRAYDLRRHMNRKTPCAVVVSAAELTAKDIEKAYTCHHCGRRYATHSGLSRHIHKSCKVLAKEKEAIAQNLIQADGEVSERLKQLEAQLASLSARSPTTVIYAGTTVTNSQVTHNTVAGQMQINKAEQMQINRAEQMQANQIGQVQPPDQVSSAPRDHAGWPPKWGSAPEDVLPFYPNSLPALTGDYLASASLEQRHTGPESEQSASFVVALLRTLREDIHHRNIYVSPNRADQAMIKLAERWEHIPVSQAKRELLEHMATRIGELEGSASLCGGDVAGAINAGSRELVQELSKSLSALLLWRPVAVEPAIDAAHPKEAASSPAERGAVTRMTPNGPRDEMRLRQIQADTFVVNLETSAGVWGPEDIQGADLEAIAIAVVGSTAVQVQRGENGNLHMVLVAVEHPALALRYSYTKGWIERPAAALAAHLCSRLASIASCYIEETKASSLALVATFLRERLVAYDGEKTEPGPWFYEPWALRVLARFSRVAAQRCSLDTPGYQALRRIMVRRLNVKDPDDDTDLAIAHRVALEVVQR